MQDAGAAATRAAERDLEERLLAIWREVLDTSDVGLDDNFFDHGGQSILLIRVHHRLIRELGRQIPIVSLFRYPSVRALARHLSGGEELQGQGDHLAERRLAGRQRLDSRRSIRRPGDSGEASEQISRPSRPDVTEPNLRAWERPWISK